MCRQSAATPETNGDKLEREGTWSGGGCILGGIWGNNVATYDGGSGRVRQM